MKGIDVIEVSKFYKKFANRHKFLTIKSALVNQTLFSDLKAEEKFQALKDVSFQVEAGKTLGIIGENGSGKSTMLKILAGISRPTSGQVKANGRISALIELGAGFHPEISGRENIFINGIILGLSKRQIQEKYAEIVAFAELEDFIESPVKSYSSGMFMRLGFSIAINVNPDILLIDEVLAVGDATFVPKCLDKINEFRRNGKTIIFVSHDLSTVVRICDEVIWLKNGSIEDRGYPKRVVDAYLEYVGKKGESKAQKQHEDEEKSQGKDRKKRWGSGEVTLANVRMYDGQGREKYMFESGGRMAIAFDVEAKAPEEDFVFGLAIFNSEGVLCYGSNTYLEKLVAQKLSGKGSVKIDIPRLDLSRGSYFLDLAVHKRDGFPFDYHHFQHSFQVISSAQSVGLLEIAHTWTFSPNIRIKPS